jgi:hypothetical protein
MALRANGNTWRSAGVAAAAVFAGWLPSLSYRAWNERADGVGVALIVGLGVARGVVYPWLIGLLALPFVPDPPAGEALAMLQLGGALLLVPRLRAFDVQTTDGAFRFALAVAGWLVVALAVTFELQHWGPTLGCGLLAGGLLAWYLWHAKLNVSTSTRSAPAPLGAIAVGAATFAAAMACVMGSVALAPWAEALVARFRPPSIEQARPSPPQRHATPPAVRPALPPYPPNLQGVAESESDAAVQNDTQTWCAFNNLRGMRHAPRLVSLRWAQLEWRYHQGEAAAACEIHRLISRAVPERGDCTNDNLDAANIECEAREARDRKYQNGLR